MGTVSRLHQRARPAARRLSSDEEALAAARALALDFSRLSSDRDINRQLPADELDSLAQSGLLGIAIPSDHDGLDISNAILAEIIAIVAEGDPSIAAAAQNHFHLLEILRVAATDEQRAGYFAKVLSGDLLAGTSSRPDQPEETIRIARDDGGFRLSGRQAHAAGVLFADWLAIPARDPADKPVLVLLPRDREGIQIIDDWDGFGQRTSGSATVILHDVLVEADAMVAVTEGLTQTSTVDAVGRITHAGIDLGIARAAFRDCVDFVRNQARDKIATASPTSNPLTIARIGQIAIRIEAAAAMIERAGVRIDSAQIEPTDEAIIDATLSVAAAGVLAAAIAIEASTALFDLAGPSATRIGFNLDRHWRNARAHTAEHPDAQHYSSIGNFHLNGVAPPV